MGTSSAIMTEEDTEMKKWYVEFKCYGKQKYLGGIVAKDGKEAIEFVKSRFIGATSFKVWHDDEEEE